MNERIRQLAEQAGDDWDHTLESDKEFLKKFVQLIVRECADICYNRDYTDGSAYGEAIEEHFGVEE